MEDDEAFDEIYEQINSHIESLEEEQTPYEGSTWTPTQLKAADETSEEAADQIFHDVDF